MKAAAHRQWRLRAVAAGSGLALTGAALTAWNRCTVARAAPGSTPITERVTVCVPARNEAERLPALIGDLRAQTGISQLRILIFDDDSTDGTAEYAHRAIDGDPRCTLLRGHTAPPPGWTGKAAACRTLAETAQRPEGPEPTAADVLIFLDADIRLDPGALAAAVESLRRRGVALLAPWPRQQAATAIEYLVQPLLCWSWASTLPMACAERGSHASTAVACGQFLVFDAAAYSAIDGHAAVAGSVTEDLDIARTLRRAGHRTAVVAAGPLARTRMYRGAGDLRAGYSRWLWSAYGGSVPAGLAVGCAAAWAYWLPPAAALLARGRLRRIGLLGYTAAVTGRLLARGLETGEPPRPRDVTVAAAHPLSVATYFYLWSHSHLRRRRNALTWKGRGIATRRRFAEVHVHAPADRLPADSVRRSAAPR